MMRAILKNPLTIWMKWFLRSRILISKNKRKHLYLGYMADIKNTTIGNYNTFNSNVNINNAKIGDYTYVGANSELSNVTIGKFCSIAPRVKIGLGIHPTDMISTSPIFFSTRKQCQITFSDKNYVEEYGNVTIGNDVWIGYGAVILDNVSIGDGAIIAAGAVVSKDVEPYSIVGGVPARLIKKRFDDETISNLLKMKWWNYDIKWLNDNAQFFAKSKTFINHLKV